MAKKIGRPKVPKKVKERRGTLNTTREKESTGDPYGETLVNITIPDYLSPAEKKEYKYYMVRLNQLGILRQEDLILVESLATNIVLYKRARKHLIEKGDLEESYRNGVKSHPMIKNYKEYLSKVLELSSRLAIGPTARASLKLGDPKGGHSPDDDAEFGDV